MSIIEIISIVIASTATVLGGMWWLLSKVFKLGQEREHIGAFEKNTKKALTDINNKLEKIGSTVDNHSITLIAICALLDNKYPKNKIGSYMKKSPRQLSPSGEKILSLVNGEQFLNNNKKQLFQIIDKYQPKTKLDVQNNAMTALLYYTTTDAFNHIKDIVYDLPEMDTPEGKYELTLNDVCFVLSIPLRDMYIKENHIE